MARPDPKVKQKNVRFSERELEMLGELVEQLQKNEAEVVRMALHKFYENTKRKEKR